MQQVIQISLSGHSTMFRLDADSYDELRQYLESARRRLKDDPDQEEVMRDLEQSIGNKLAAWPRSGESVISLAEVEAILAEVGPVDVGGNNLSVEDSTPREGRRLYRIEEGQDVFGVCQGLAAYSNISVDWVRTIFFFLALITGGVFILVYIAMAFILPVARTREEYFALQKALPKTM